MVRLYRIGEVAALTRVSIRTLHHYDQIGLLRPSGHTEGGHRLYAEADLLRLQQILTLRYLGFSLKQIGRLLDRPDFDLMASMHVQRRALRDRIAELEQIDAALGELLARRRTAGRWAWDLVASLAATVQDGLTQRSDAMEKMKEYYTPEQLKQFEELGKQTPPELIAEIEQGWTDLLAEMRSNRDLDPASDAARALAERWDTLTMKVEDAYRAHPDLWAAIGENYRKGSFAELDRAPNAEDMAFIEQAKAARR